MKFKRAISVVLTMIVVLSCSVDALALTVNMNTGADVVQVQAGGNTFFNIEFANPNYEPNAEQIYTMSLGEEIVFWRHSGTTGKRWNMGPWGYQDDAWVQKLMNGKIDKLMTSEWYLPDGVLYFLNNGGSWEDIKVTFQCKLTDGTPLNHEDVFKNGVVDCYIQGNKIKAQFYPKFTTQVGVPIKSGTRIELNRGIYPYSFTMFSMWGPGRHYGASRVWDRWYEPQETAENRHAGFDMFTYDDIINNSGYLTGGKNIKNFAYNQWNPKGTKTETGQYHEPSISTDKARIGDGTFDGGGATGIGFNFPIYITFEINPIQEKKGNALYVSEYSIVNMADDADPDEMTTHASMQAYSNREQLIRFFGSEELYKRVVKMICEEVYSIDDDYALDLFAENVYNSEVVCSLLDKTSAGELNTLIEKAKADMSSEELKNHGDPVGTSIADFILDPIYNGNGDTVGSIEMLDSGSSKDIKTRYNNQEITYNDFGSGGFILNAVFSNKNLGQIIASKYIKNERNKHNLVTDTESDKIYSAKAQLYQALRFASPKDGVQPADIDKISFLNAMRSVSLRQDGTYTAGDMEKWQDSRSPGFSNYAGWNALTHKGEIAMIYEEDGKSVYNKDFTSKTKGKENDKQTIEYFAHVYGYSLNSHLELALGAKYVESADGSIIKTFLCDSLPKRVADGTIQLYDIMLITNKVSQMVAKNARGLLTQNDINWLASSVKSLNNVDVGNTPLFRVVFGGENLNSMSEDEKIAAKSSSIGKYLLKDDSGTVSTSASVIKTGNMAGMMDEIEKSDAKTVILLPTISHIMDKEIGQDAFRKLAYARAERLYELIRSNKVFSKATLSDGYRERLITDNEDDLMVLDMNKYYTEMNFSKFQNEKFYHTGYTSGSLSETTFTRLFGDNEGVKHAASTLYDLGIVGNKTTIKENDTFYLDTGSSKKIKEKYTDKHTRLWDATAFKFNTSEEVERFLEDAIWRSGEFPVYTSVIPQDKSTIDFSYNYDGGVAYTDVIIDKGCDIVVSGFSIGNNGEITELKKTKQGITFPYTLPVAATRYSMVAPFADDYYKGLENPALTDEIYGAYSMVACIPEGMDDGDFYENAKKVVDEAKANGTIVDGAVLEGHGIRIHVGKEAVKNTLVYPTQSQLDNGTPIRLAMFYAEIKKPEVVKVYELTDGVNVVHVKTTTSPAVVNDDAVKVEDENMDGTDYEVGEAYVSTDLYDVTNTTPWSEIDNNTNVYDNEVIYDAGELSLDPEKQQRVYVRMVGELPTVKPPLPGDFRITQQTIGKKFDTSSLDIVAKDKLISFNSARHKYYTRRGRVRRCYIYETSSDTYNINYAMNTNGDSKIFSNITPLESGDITGSRTWNKSRTTNTTLYPKYTFVAWRGYDKPVAASYANDSWVLDDVYSKFGIGSAKERTASELNSSYSKDSKFEWTIGSGSDTYVRFPCSHGYNHSGTVGQYKKASNNGTVSVEVYEGWKGAQAPANYSNASTSMGSASLTSAYKGTTTGDVITYHPYVMMKYQDINGNTNSVNVLSKYKSSITPINTIEFGVQRGSNTSLGITSSMWSTHKRATNAKGANNVIAGGATYNLGNNGAQLPKIGVTTYQWYVPNDAASAVVSGAGNTQTKAEQSHNNAVNSLKTALTGNKVLQHLKAGSNNFIVSPGMSTPWLGSGLNLTNNTNAESKKYWFGGMVNPKTKIISDDGTNREYYRISSDTSGNIILTKGNHTDHTFNINHDNNYILNNMNAEWKEINAKTGLVSAYLGSIIRRAGNDTSYGAAGGMWYNEAFPGICVVKQTTTFTVGMDTGSYASLQNVVDMRLVAGGTNSKADIYKNFNDSWFAVEGKNVNFNFRGKTLTLNTGELNLRSKTFYIPNATVYDND